MHRRDFIRSLSRIAAFFSLDRLRCAAPLPVRFLNLTRHVGLKVAPVYGGGCATAVSSKRPAAVRATAGKWIKAL